MRCPSLHVSLLLPLTFELLVRAVLELRPQRGVGLLRDQAQHARRACGGTSATQAPGPAMAAAPHSVWRTTAPVQPQRAPHTCSAGSSLRHRAVATSTSFSSDPASWPMLGSHT